MKHFQRVGIKKMPWKICQHKHMDRQWAKESVYTKMGTNAHRHTRTHIHKKDNGCCVSFVKMLRQKQRVLAKDSGIVQYQQQRFNIHQVSLNSTKHTYTHNGSHSYRERGFDTRAYSITALRGNEIQEGIHSSVAIGGVTPLKRKRNKPIVTTYWIVHTVVFVKITHKTVSISIFLAQKPFGLSATDIFRRLSAKTTRIWNWDERNTPNYYYYYHFDCWKKKTKFPQ